MGSVSPSPFTITTFNFNNPYNRTNYLIMGNGNTGWAVYANFSTGSFKVAMNTPFILIIESAYGTSYSGVTFIGTSYTGLNNAANYPSFSSPFMQVGYFSGTNPYITI